MLSLFFPFLDCGPFKRSYKGYKYRFHPTDKLFAFSTWQCPNQGIGLRNSPGKTKPRTNPDIARRSQGRERARPTTTTTTTTTWSAAPAKLYNFKREERESGRPERKEKKRRKKKVPDLSQRRAFSSFFLFYPTKFFTQFVSNTWNKSGLRVVRKNMRENFGIRVDLH